jgi:hypothetical protein
VTASVDFVASTAATRMWRVYKESGRPMPRFSEDDVIDYMVLEAVMLKARHEDAEAQKEAEKEAARKKWKEDTSSLDEFRG